jgi:glycogen operon protein
LYRHNGKRPYASINLVTSHDGFTLRDLVSYNEKHNEDNGEDNRDGDNHNHSWNCGAEGETDDESINARRRRQQRNFLATVFLSQGVPMIPAGDECGRTQRGNNNAYCQDNEISWFDWTRLDQSEGRTLLDFTRRLIQIRHAHPVFRRPKFFQGRKIRGSDVKDVMWFSPDGTEMTDEEWNTHFVRSMGLFLSGRTMDVRNEHGRLIEDESFLLLFNAHHAPMPFILPGRRDAQWDLVLDTAAENGEAPSDQRTHQGNSTLVLVERSFCLLQLADNARQEGSGMLG